MNKNHGAGQPLDSRQLLAFVTLANTGSFTLAGRDLFLSQSAISHSLKSLEREIGCRLFDRANKKVHLTPAGEHLQHFAKKILADMAEARKSIEQRAHWGRGRLRVAAGESVCQNLLPQILRALQKDFADWSISVVPGDTNYCVEALRHQRVDVAVALAPGRADAVDVQPLFTDELLWMVSPEHPWAKSGTAVRGEIPAQKIIFNSAVSHSFQLVEEYFQRDGIRPRVGLELGNFEAVKEMVKLGQGVSVMAAWAVRKELAEGTLVSLPLGKRKLKRNWCLLRSRGSKPGLAEETFVRFCLDAARKLSAPAGEAPNCL